MFSFLANAFPKTPAFQSQFPFHSFLHACSIWSDNMHQLVRFLCCVAQALGICVHQLLVPGPSIVVGLVEHRLCLKCHLPDDIGVVICRKVLGCLESRRPLRAPPSTLYSSPLWQFFVSGLLSLCPALLLISV